MIARALLELSMKVLFCRVSRLVPVIAVRGADGGVKLVVYTAVPFTTLRLDIYPVKYGVLAL